MPSGQFRGDLAKLRNSIVNSQALAGVARELTESGLGEYVLLGRGEVNTGGQAKASILADTVESLIGAVYLEHGLEGPARHPEAVSGTAGDGPRWARPWVEVQPAGVDLGPWAGVPATTCPLGAPIMTGGSLRWCT